MQSSNPYSQDRSKTHVQENRPPGSLIEEAKTKWLIADLQTVYDEVYEKVICEMLFGKEERLMHKVFTGKLHKEVPQFLKSYELRKLVFGRIVDNMFTRLSQ